MQQQQAPTTDITSATVPQSPSSVAAVGVVTAAATASSSAPTPTQAPSQQPPPPVVQTSSSAESTMTATVPVAPQNPFMDDPEVAAPDMVPNPNNNAAVAAAMMNDGTDMVGTPTTSTVVAGSGSALVQRELVGGSLGVSSVTLESTNSNVPSIQSPPRRQMTPPPQPSSPCPGVASVVSTTPTTSQQQPLPGSPMHSGIEVIQSAGALFPPPTTIPDINSFDNSISSQLGGSMMSLDHHVQQQNPHQYVPQQQQQHYFSQPQPQQNQQHQLHRSIFDDDENTEPSSGANTGDNPQGEDAPEGASIGMASGLDGGGSSAGGGSSICGGPQIDPLMGESGGVTNGAVVSGVPRSADAANSNTTEVVVAGSFARLWENTRRKLSRVSSRGPNSGDEDDDDDEDGNRQMEGVLICGYLQKLGRNGKWQTRWFETDGECLSYYKSEKRSKLLATLDLEKVGDIAMDETDTQDRAFTIQVLDRLYHLRANSRASCKDWVITLNRVKEARMQQGNVKLVHLSSGSGGILSRVNRSLQQQPAKPPVDLLDQASDHDVAPRVVVVANRPRSRAVAETMEFDNMYNEEMGGATSVESFVGQQRQQQQQHGDAIYESRSTSSLGTKVLARWTKHKSSLNKIGSKLLNWARSVRHMQCLNPEDVQLDRHVHPPGHDDERFRKTHQRRKEEEVSVASTSGGISGATNSVITHNNNSGNSGSGNKDGLSAWIGKETSMTKLAGAAPATAEVVGGVAAQSDAAPVAKGSAAATSTSTILTGVTGSSSTPSSSSSPRVVGGGTDSVAADYDFNKERSMSMGSDSERVLS